MSHEIKCVVWDLDDTIWTGTLLTGPVEARAHVVDLIRRLDGRGVLQSIASRNEHELALERLRALEIADYFLAPQISFNTKSMAIERIAKVLNLGLDSFAFVDDQEFERAEVSFALPMVRCFDASSAADLERLSTLAPSLVTEETRTRRQMYRLDTLRKEAEESFTGNNEEFLRTLDLSFTIVRAQPDDLDRAHDLTVRTHQLNATGYTYSREELTELCASPAHRLYVATLSDRFGTYGRIGLALLETTAREWRMKLLLMSCRTMSRGVGGVFLRELLNLARQEGVRFVGEFVPTDRNRLMYVTYRFAGFREIPGTADPVLLEHDLTSIAERPAYYRIDVRP